MKSKRLWVMFIALLLALMLTPSTARACSCVPEASPEVASKQANAIFAGEVIGVDRNWFGLQVDLKNRFYLPQYGCITMGVLVLLAGYLLTGLRRPRSEQ